jgi:hypothetical protein
MANNSRILSHLALVVGGDPNPLLVAWRVVFGLVVLQVVVVMGSVLAYL